MWGAWGGGGLDELSDTISNRLDNQEIKNKQQHPKTRKRKQPQNPPLDSSNFFLRLPVKMKWGSSPRVGCWGKEGAQTCLPPPLPGGPSGAGPRPHPSGPLPAAAPEPDRRLVPADVWPARMKGAFHRRRPGRCHLPWTRTPPRRTQCVIIVFLIEM